MTAATLTLAPALASASPFSVALSATTSTDNAGAHPDLTLKIDTGGSAEDLKDVSISLPDGFMGSLAAIVPKCTLAQAASSTCPAGSQIGTVLVTAIVDQSTIKLPGAIYMTDGQLGDPAGLSIDIPAVVGGVDLGRVVVPARLRLRCSAGLCTNPPAPGIFKGIDAIAIDVPRSITDPHGVTSFRVREITLEITGDVGGPNPPLLTNPTDCSPTPAPLAFKGTFTSYQGSSVAAPDVPYAVVNCDTVPHAPALAISLSSAAAGTATGLTATVDLSAGNAGITSIDARLPVSIGPRLAGLGGACLAADIDVEPPAACVSANSIVGTLTVTTPLLQTDLVGDVYLSEAVGGELARLMIRLSDPALGILVRLNVTIYTLPDQSLSLVFENIPDVPLTKFILDIPGSANSGKLLVVKAASVCRNDSATRVDFIGHDGRVWSTAAEMPLTGCAPAFGITGGPDLEPGGGSGYTTDSTPTFTFSSPAEPPYVAPVTYSCSIDGASPTPCSGAGTHTVSPALSDGMHSFAVTATGASGSPSPSTDKANFLVDTTVPDTSITGGPAAGSTISDSTPQFTFSSPENGSGFECRVDGGAYTACTSPLTTTTLTNASHTFYVRAKDRAGNTDPTPASRTFIVDNSDMTPPVTTITDGPSGVTLDPSPSFTFSAVGTATFECRIDDGAFSSCGSPYTPPAPLAAGAHTFEVKATDSFSNAGLPVSRAFTVDNPFAPTVGLALSTLQARANPAVTINFASSAGEDLKQISVSLPDGLIASLRAADQCMLAVAAAGSCPASARIGTVQAEATVDQSTIVLDGEVFLTERSDPADIAGLSIKVPVKVGAVEFATVIVPVRVMLRGNGVGIDVVSGEIPRSLTSTLNEVVEFNLSKIKLEFGSAGGAGNPLFYNASGCSGSAITASFAGYGASTGSATDGYQPNGCGDLGFSTTLSAKVEDLVTGKPPAAGKGARFTATVTSNPGDAAIKAADVTLPKPLTVEVTKLPFACTIPEYAMNACPASARVGSASAITPLLPSALTGSVYLLQNPLGSTRAMPRMLVKLTGAANIDLIAQTTFVNKTQINAVFENIPDVPLNTFTMRLDNLLTVTKDGCKTPAANRSITGVGTAHNGRSTPLTAPLEINCAGYAFKVKFRYRGKKTTLRLSARAENGQGRLKKLMLRMPRGLVINAGALKRKLIIRVNGKRLRRGCAKARGRSTLIVGFCGRKGTRVDLTLLPGSLKAVKRLRSPRLSVTTTDGTGKTVRSSLPLRSKAFRSFRQP
ncbi:MAG: hypothetical protein WAP35_11170 [Solirubrobacterales bacterium]